MYTCILCRCTHTKCSFANKRVRTQNRVWKRAFSLRSCASRHSAKFFCIITIFLITISPIFKRVLFWYLLLFCQDWVPGRLQSQDVLYGSRLLAPHLLQLCIPPNMVWGKQNRFRYTDSSSERRGDGVQEQFLNRLLSEAPLWPTTSAKQCDSFGRFTSSFLLMRIYHRYM